MFVLHTESVIEEDPESSDVARPVRRDTELGLLKHNVSIHIIEDGVGDNPNSVCHPYG